MSAPGPLARRLVEVAARHPALAALASPLGAPSASGRPARLRIRGASGSSGALVLAALLEETPRPMAVIAPDIDRAEAWRDDLEFLLGEDRVVYLPPLDVVAWSHQLATAPVRDDRLQAIVRLGDPQPPIAVLPAAALHRLVPKPDRVRARAITLERGFGADPEDLVRRLIVGGYRAVAEIGESGEVSRRGGIVDVYGPGLERPVRVEFDGDVVASLRAFDITSQRSIGPLDRVRIAPAREVLYPDDLDERLRPFDRGSFPSELDGRRLRDLVGEGIYFDGVDWLAPILDVKLTSLLDALPPGCALWLDEPGAIERELETVEREAERLEGEARAKAPHLPPREALFDPPARVLERLHARTRLESTLAAPAGKADETVAVDARPQPSFGRKLDLLRSELKRLGDLGYERIVVCDNRGQAERLEEILGDGIASIEVGSIGAGFVLPGAKLALFTDHEIFARYRRRG